LSSCDGNDTPVVVYWNSTTFTDLKPEDLVIPTGFTRRLGD
jgi:hypothetical protein